MSKVGIEISKPTKNVLTCENRDKIFSSEFQDLRIFQQGAGLLSHTNRLFTINHGLGYVPAFLVHTQTEGGYWITDTDYVISPHIPIVTGADYLDRQIIAWADKQNLYVKAQTNFGVAHYSLSSTTLAECLANEDDGGYDAGWWETGNGTDGVNDGATRFGSITLANSQSIYNAQLNLYIGGRNGSGEVKMLVSGIDEDNTLNFNAGTAATARTKTTANTASNSTLSVGNTLGVDVTSIVSEIISRAGWSSGNAMGFIMNDNGTTANNTYYEDSFSGVWGVYSSYTNLQIIPTFNLARFKYTIFLNKIN